MNSSVSNPEREIREFLARKVAEGFDQEEDIVETAMDYFADGEFADDFSPEGLHEFVQKLTAELITAQVEAEKSWPQETDCDRLDRAFERLESSGIIARQNFTCCQTCGHAEIWEEIEQARGEQELSGYVFYHQQDTERVLEEGMLYLAYGSTDGADENSLQIAASVVNELKNSGFNVDWNGSAEKRICVQGFKWQRRLKL